tara:strand:+ start:55 stop:951 length:897 start_codon:yes stop_codon:yes gene_type:complete
MTKELYQRLAADVISDPYSTPVEEANLSTEDYINLLKKAALTTGEILSPASDIAEAKEGSAKIMQGDISGLPQMLGGIAGIAIPGSKAIREGGQKVAEKIIPKASQKTQLGTTTIPTYKKVEKIFKKDKIKGNTLDFGAGRGLGAKEIKADTFEPFPRENFKPNYTSSSDIPTESYNKITSLNVLNVLPKTERTKAILEIGRILKTKGSAIISTRGDDVLKTKTGIKGNEPMSVILPDGRFQKGFTEKELVEELKSTLGDNFNIESISGVGKAAVKITKKKVGGMVMKNNNYNTQRAI